MSVYSYDDFHELELEVEDLRKERKVLQDRVKQLELQAHERVVNGGEY